MRKKMNKDEVVKIMIESFNSDNYKMAEAAGMLESEIKKNLETSQPSIEYMLSNIYDILVTNSIIKND
jgi:hypothetical protein